MKLERLSLQLENRGFRSRRSLAYVKSEDLDSFFPSPDKLLLAERRVLEAELSNIKAESHHQFNPNHPWAKTIEYDSNNCNKQYTPAMVTWGCNQRKFWGECEHLKPKPLNDSKSTGPKSGRTVRKSKATRSFI